MQATRRELDYGAKYRKAVAKIIDDLDVLPEFYRYPADHWIHLCYRARLSAYRQGPRITHCPNRYGLQAHRGRTSSLAQSQRTRT
jgi:hypothetical protein